MFVIEVNKSSELRLLPESGAFSYTGGLAMLYPNAVYPKHSHTVCVNFGQRKKDIHLDVLLLELPGFTVWASYRHAVKKHAGGMF